MHPSCHSCAFSAGFFIAPRGPQKSQLLCWTLSFSVGEKTDSFQAQAIANTVLLIGNRSIMMPYWHLGE